MFFISRSDTDQATTILYIKMEFKKWHDHECDKGVVVRNLIVGTKVYARKDDGKIPPRDLLSTIGRTKTFICGTCGMRIMDMEDEMSMYDMSMRINTVLKAYADVYKGEGMAMVQKFRDQGKYFMSYYIMTMNNQDVANKTKPSIVLSPNKQHFIPDPKWDQNVALTSKWWEDDKCDYDNQYSIMEHTSSVIESLIAYGGGTMEERMKSSKAATDRGTYIHENYGKMILANAVSVFPGYENFQTVLPGRIIWNNFSLIGCTPDGLTVPSESTFHEYLEKIWEHNPKDPVPDSLMRLARKGAPHIIHEIKSLQKACARVREDWVDSKFYTFQRVGGENEEFKRDVVNYIAKMFIAAGYMQKDEISRSKYAQIEGEKVEQYTCTDPEGKYYDTGKSKPSAFTRTCKIALTDAIDYKSINLISGQVVKQLADHPLYNEEIDEKTGKKKPSKKCTVKREGGFYPCRKVLNKVGKCKIIFYRRHPVTKEPIKSFDLDFDESPFRLTVNGDHFIQTMTQMATCTWLNKNMKHMYTSVLSFSDGTAAPAVQISWEQNMTLDLIDDYMYHTCKRVREVCPKTWAQVFRKAEFTGVPLCLRPDISVDIDSYIPPKVGMENIEEMDAKESEDMFNSMMKCFEMTEDTTADKPIKKRKRVTFEDDIIEVKKLTKIHRGRQATHEISDEED